MAVEGVTYALDALPDPRPGAAFVAVLHFGAKTKGHRR